MCPDPPCRLPATNVTLASAGSICRSHTGIMSNAYNAVNNEENGIDESALLPQHNGDELIQDAQPWRPKYSPKFYIFAFILLISPFFVFMLRTHEVKHESDPKFTATTAASWIGQHQSDGVATDNWGTSEFPTQVGYAGATATGIEAAAMETSPSRPFGLANSCQDKIFIREQHFGSLSPYFSAPQAAEIPHASVHVPAGFKLDEVHVLHRHASRYPTSSEKGHAVAFARKLSSHRNNLKFSGPLQFLNEWSYPLGSAGLTSKGRGEMFVSGVKFRMWYGKLLTSLSHKLVLWTGSEQRMIDSAINFIGGFFGLPLENDPYHLVVTLETPGQNNTLAPWQNCAKEGDAKSDPKVLKWQTKFLTQAVDRLQPYVAGVSLKHADVFGMMEICAYETASLGGSEFCDLFTDEEWRGYDYAWSLIFSLGHAFAQPMSEAYGIGYIQHLVARLTQTPIKTHNSTTNSTLDDSPHTFPLDQKIYFDFSHDTQLSTVIVALGLKQFSKTLSTEHVIGGTYWRTSYLTPFGANIVFQILQQKEKRFIRVVINDAVVSLEHVGNCGQDRDGLCDLTTFIDAMKLRIQRVNYAARCSEERERMELKETVAST